MFQNLSSSNEHGWYQLCHDFSNSVYALFKKLISFPYLPRKGYNFTKY